MLKPPQCSFGAQRPECLTALLLALLLGQGWAEVRFLSSSTRVQKGCTRILAFAIEPAEVDRTLALQLTNDAVVVVRPPRVLAGHGLGFIRLEGTSEAQCQLTIADATISLDVRAVRGTSARPAITMPVSGAVVWGALRVGVELPPELQGQDCRLLLGQQVFTPADCSLAVWGPGTRLMFELAAGDLPPGRHSLRAVAGSGSSERWSSSVVIDAVAAADVAMFEA